MENNSPTDPTFDLIKDNASEVDSTTDQKDDMYEKMPDWLAKSLSSKILSPIYSKILQHKTLEPIMKKLTSREIVVYLICGVLTTILAFSLYLIFFNMGLNIVANNAIVSVTAVLFAFAINKHFVFLSRDWRPSVTIVELVKFSGGRLGVSLIETGILYLLVDIFNLSEPLCKAFTLIMVVVVNYVISKLIF